METPKFLPKSIYRSLARYAWLLCGFAAGCSSTAKQEIKDPADPGFRVQYELYSDAGPGKPPWVVLLPPTGGANTLDRRYARKLQAQGASVLLITDWTGLRDESVDLGIHNKGLARSLRAFDLLRERAGGAKLRLFGTSLGGLFAAAMTFHRPEGVEKLALIVTGGPLSKVLAQSKMGSIEKLKEERRKTLGFNDDNAYEQILAERIPLDFVGKGACRLPPDKILMMIARSDESVPAETQEALWEQLGRPKRIDVDGGHARVIVHAYLLKTSELTDFISRIE